MHSFSRSTSLRVEEIEQLIKKCRPMRKAARLYHDRRLKPLVWSRRGVDPQIDSQLDLVTAIVAGPEVTDFMVADVRR
jgi:hypothetical protein